MQKLVIHAIGGLLALCSVFAHADAISTTAQAINALPQVEMPSQGQRAERGSNMMWPAVDRSSAVRASAGPSASSDAADHPIGMLVGALAIMAVMARRRWHNRG